MSEVAGALSDGIDPGAAGAAEGGAGAGGGSQSGGGGPAAAGTQGTGTAGAGEGASGSGGEQASSQYPAWMNGLADELRNDPDLARYGSVEDLAKGLKETRAWARGRVPIPQDDAGWKEFGEKLRPESADKYALEVPEGDSGAMAAEYRKFAFDEGIPARHAEATARFFNRVQAEQLSKIATTNQEELRALDLELGAHGYNVRLEATRAMLSAAGIDAESTDAMVRALEQTHGAGKTLRALFTLAERTGELEKVDSTSVALNMGGMSPQAAQAEINKLMNDKAFMDKAGTKGTPEAAKWKRLNEAAAGRK
ncbi:hypothetical protein [Novosphingobium huizhouense]|uniref:hypothetical protein n=1 Tax=Novosphingobium huizhouense TaxID=2866625 RepID=UPI001CD86ABC|nr:hypothetical protein [Novosphingobium huizhouense]